ncbi:MAG: DUF2017 domain-containing protein [Mycobacteriales bacterium]
MRFTRHKREVRAEADDVEVQILAQLAQELLGLIREPELPEDPLAAMVGLPDGDVTAPDDPVLGRLLPDAYRDDPRASGDFRRYTDAELRAGKRAAAHVVLRSLPDGGGTVQLDRDQADQWLSCLNDMRLALGTSLEVTEDTDVEDFAHDDPRYSAMHVYGWLGYLQESLLSCLEPRAQK